MMPSEREIRLSNDPSLCVTDVIILEHSKLLIDVSLCLVTNANQHETIFSRLPKIIESHLYFKHVVLYSDMLRELKNLIFSPGIVSDIKNSKLPFLIMPWFEPCHHWMLVCLFYLVLVCPLIILGLVYTVGLTVKLKRILVVTELESIVIVPSLFFDA